MVSDPGGSWLIILRNMARGDREEVDDETYRFFLRIAIAGLVLVFVGVPLLIYILQA
jgi:hypothetical protein